MKMKLATLIIATLLASGTQAKPTKNYEMTAYGLGSTSCGAYEAALTTQKEALYLEWAAGFLSGVSSERGGNIMGHIDIAGGTAWIKKFCQEHPLEPFLSALTYLIGELEKD